MQVYLYADDKETIITQFEVSENLVISALDAAYDITLAEMNNECDAHIRVDQFTRDIMFNTTSEVTRFIFTLTDPRSRLVEPVLGIKQVGKHTDLQLLMVQIGHKRPIDIEHEGEVYHYAFG